MRVRDFFRGFSVGIILTCCVLFIVFKGSNQISDEYVIERAKQLNMVFKDEDSSILMQNTTENGNTANQNETNDSTVKEESSDKTTTEQGKDNAGDSSDDKNANQQDKDTDLEDKNLTVETVTIDITKGMTSEDVANMLYDLAIIDDVIKFSYYLHNNGYSLRVNVGTFEIPSDASYEEIAKIITKS